VDFAAMLQRAALVAGKGDPLFDHVIVDDLQDSTLAAEALNIMEQRKITSVVVVEDGTQQVAGVVHVHDLWGTEMF